MAPRPPEEAGALERLGEELRDRFARDGDAADLARAVAALEEALELTPAGIPHQISEPWTAGLHAGDPVGVFLDDLIATLSCHLPQVVKLGFRVLIDRTHPHI